VRAEPWIETYRMTKTGAYPSHLVTTGTLNDGTPVVIRPIRPADASIETEFVRNLSPDARYFRFMDTLRELSPDMLTHFIHIDYHDHMALIATVQQDGRDLEIGVARYHVDAEAPESCEFALAVADAWIRKGVGTLLMNALLAAARERGLKHIYGDILASNHKMLEFMSKLGFDLVTRSQDTPVTRAARKI
jgi:acetyltransferase